MLRKPVRGLTVVKFTSAGFSIAMFHRIQTVWSLFFGYRENSKEVKKYGMAPVQPRP
jgi:hypothetical protein